MEAIKIGVLSFSDGRDRVHHSLVEEIKRNENLIVDSLAKCENVTVIPGTEIINGADEARKQQRFLRSKEVDCVVFNVSVFAFPNYAVIAGRELGKPVIIVCPENGALPGLGGMLAIAGGLRQIGISCETVWGSLAEEEALKKVLVTARAAAVKNKLSGQVYGLFGGRSIGMSTGAPSVDIWHRQFGVDVEHVGEVEIIRRAQEMSDESVAAGLKWLKEMCKDIVWQDDVLSDETLGFQLKCYLATEELVKERGIDFLGVKCHFDLSEHYVTQCISCALFNDPYDWRGSKEPTVFSCEADSDGALTMQMLKLLAGEPTLLTDLRTYDRQDGVFVLCNCGAQATWFAERSSNPADNLRNVTLYPTIEKYRAGGAHVQFINKPGPVTFARLTRSPEGYEMTIFQGELISLPEEKLQETCPEWPHAFALIDLEPEELFEKYYSNHVHFVCGDWTQELVKLCELLGVEARLLTK